MKPLVSTGWLEKNLTKVRIIDGSWHMPDSNRNSLEEFKKNHIQNSVFFDLDKNSNQSSDLPHMLPEKTQWERLNSDHGIKNSDHIIIYDNSDVISSCRWWFSYLFFGHDPDLVSVLDGGYKKWVGERKKVTNEIKVFEKSKYVAQEKKLVFNKQQIIENINVKKFLVVDARGAKRFHGISPEPRKGLKSGNIEGSKNLPFQNCINLKDNSFKNKEELKRIFNDFMILNTKEKVFSCGSGVTACILGLANSIISGKTPLVYDGSWADYGRE